jgi:hypothetical protein
MLCMLVVCFNTVLPADPPTQPPSEIELVKPKMTFADAMKPYTDMKYDYSGYIDKKGERHGEGLGCSAFTSVVLHRMRDGDKWLPGYDDSVYKLYGEDAAKHFGLKKAGKFESIALLDQAQTKSMLKGGELSGGQLYLFNARKEKNGHVGFVRVTDTGDIEQWHYSSISKGLYKGDFRKWLQESMYRAATVELYVVPEKK